MGTREPDTQFQTGLRRFSGLLLGVAAVLTVLIFVINVALHRPLLDAVLFSLVIAVGITPQLLPAVVSTSLAAGSRQLAKSKVLVKRLVSIEDLGDIDLLVTDKTGTLTQGEVTYTRAVDPAGEPSSRVRGLGLACTEPGGANALDAALRRAGGAPEEAFTRCGSLPFDHDRRMASVLVDDADGTGMLIVKGAPESVLARCADVPVEADRTVRVLFGAGARVIAVATRPAAGEVVVDAASEQHLRLAGFLVFADTPKQGADAALRRLADLGVTVKIATGDNLSVAETVCAGLGLSTEESLT